MLYESLDLTFHRTGRGAHRVHATCPLAGDASGPFRPPRVAAVAPPPGTRDLVPACRAEINLDPREIGAALFDAVFAGPVLLCLRESFERAQARGYGLRLRLRLDACPELAGLPWELLYDRRHARFLGQSEGTPIVRYLEVPEPIEPLVVRPPLRILLVIASPRGLSALDADREKAVLQAALAGGKRLASLEVLERATPASLADRLGTVRPHVLHFAGHGHFGSEAEDGSLLFESKMGEPEAVSGLRLATLLAEHSDLRSATHSETLPTMS